MPPKRAKATRASPPSNEPTPHFPPPSTNIPIQADDEQRTPERSPAKRAAGGISQAQKQALIDNLQLESKHESLAFSFGRTPRLTRASSHRTRAQTPSAVCSTGPRAEDATGDAGQSHPTGVEAEEYAGVDGGACGEGDADRGAACAGEECYRSPSSSSSGEGAGAEELEEAEVRSSRFDPLHVS